MLDSGWRSHLVNHAMEDMQRSVVRGGCEEGVAGVVGDAPQRLLMVAQRAVGLGGQVQVEPCQLLVLHGGRPTSDTSATVMLHLSRGALQPAIVFRRVVEVWLKAKHPLTPKTHPDDENQPDQ